MPVVPIRSHPSATSPPASRRPPPPEPFALMAAAQMHSEGRLIDPNSAPSPLAAAGVNTSTPAT